MKNRVFPVILASLLVAGLVGTVAFAADSDPGIVLPDVKFTTTAIAEPIETTTDRVVKPGEITVTTILLPGMEPEEPVVTERAKGIVFKAESGFKANTYTGYVEGVTPGVTEQAMYDALENRNGIDLVVDIYDPSGYKDFDGLVWHGDKLVLADEDGAVLEELTIIFMGNADMNDKINLSDASTMLKVIANWDGVQIDRVASDVDGSGNVTLSDVSTVLKKVANWDVEFADPTLPGKYTMVKKSEQALHSAPAGTAWQPLCLSDGIHNELGMKFTVKEGEFATSITALCPSWGDDKGTLTFSVYKWAGDYETTVAAMPIITTTVVDYADNATLTTDLTDSSGKGLMEGEYLWRIHDGADAGEGTGVGIWFFTEMGPAEDSGMTSFLNREEFNLGPAATIYYATAK